MFSCGMLWGGWMMLDGYPPIEWAPICAHEQGKKKQRITANLYRMEPIVPPKERIDEPKTL